jgi:O-antigen ligase
MTHAEGQGVDGNTGRPPRNGLWVPLLLGSLLMLLSFSAPGREAPSSAGALDAIALVKVAARLGALCVLGLAITRSRHLPRTRVVAQCLWPLGLFVGWSLLSAFWSPLTSVSLGQVGGLLAQVMLAFVVALRCTGPQDWSKVLCHLSIAMLAFSVAVLIAHGISPEASGLDREIGWDDGSAGFVHPTAAGATASLGMVTLIAVRLLWGWRWTRVWLIPGVLAHGLLLALSTSRIAIVMGLLTLLLCFLLFSRRTVASGVIAIACILGAGAIAFDPGLELADRAFGSASGYARRGETDEQMRTINGRTILWEAVWAEILKSPLVGHGYFVTSEGGEIDVWSGPANRTAHNVLLQVIVSTGAIGTLFFLWGLARPLAACGRFLRASPPGRVLAAFLGVVGIWYAGWGLCSESFMGTVQPESVVFFTLLGMGIGNFSLGRNDMNSAANEAFVG